MRRSFCSGCVAALVKLLSFVQAFAALSAVLYAAWAADKWARHGGDIDLEHVSDIWFECAVMGAGIAVLFLVILGYVSAEITSGCCLCFYTVFATVFLLLEATLAGNLIFNKNWEQVLPHDSTGELDNLLKFVETNQDMCRGIAIGFVAIQALSLFLAMILHAMVRRTEYDSDEDFIVIRRPLLITEAAPGYPAAAEDRRVPHLNFWSSQVRQKYGLNRGEYLYNTMDPSASVPR